MNFNPLHVLDLILADWASPKVRRLIHNLIALGVSLVGIWLAANGDWLVALGALATAVYAASNRANTPQADLAGDPETTPRDEYDELDDGLSYEEAGGLFWVSPEVHVEMVNPYEVFELPAASNPRSDVSYAVAKGWEHPEEPLDPDERRFDGSPV
mgnify:FL=1